MQTINNLYTIPSKKVPISNVMCKKKIKKLGQLQFNKEFLITNMRLILSSR